MKLAKIWLVKKTSLMFLIWAVNCPIHQFVEKFLHIESLNHLNNGYHPLPKRYGVCSFCSIALKSSPLIGHNQGLIWWKSELDRVSIHGQNRLRISENRTIFIFYVKNITTFFTN